MEIKQINQELGNADLYLIDLILKGFFREGSSLLDAGCGEGRNLAFFIKNNFSVYGVDQNYSSLMMLKMAGRLLSENFNAENFIQCDLKNLPRYSDLFDYILCFSVLHFVHDLTEFKEIFNNFSRVIKKKGKLILGMNSIFGLEQHVISLGNSRFKLPGGETRFLLEQDLITLIINEFGYDLMEPVKTHMIHQKECISYLILEKQV
jgi:tellurite methyltransferase